MMADSVSRTRSQLDPYGFERPADFDYKAYEDFMATYLSILAKQSIKWAHYLDKHPLSKVTKMKKYIRKGVPAEHRPDVWMWVSGAEEKRKRSPDLYQRLLKGPFDQTLVDTIKTDIHRTFPDNIYFQDTPADPNAKRRPLFNVLLALAHNNRQVGYCQGMNFVVGLLLLIVKDENRVFWLTNTLINNILPDYYAEDMAGVKSELHVLSELIRVRCPTVHSHMEKIGVPWTILSPKWFICLYADVMPVETVLRVWDCMFNEGSKILLRVGVALVHWNREKILACENLSDVISVFRLNNTYKFTTNCHEFMKYIFKKPGSMKESRIEAIRRQALIDISTST